MNVYVLDYISNDCCDFNKNYTLALQQIHGVILLIASLSIIGISNDI